MIKTKACRGATSQLGWTRKFSKQANVFRSYPSYGQLSAGGMSEWATNRHSALQRQREPVLLGLRQVATYWQPAPRRLRWPQRRTRLLRLDKEKLPCRSTKKVPSASTMRRPAPASRCWSSPAED